MPLRILATSVAGLPAALDAALTRFGATITADVLGAVRERITSEVASAVAGLPSGGGDASLRSKRASVDVGALPHRTSTRRVLDPDVTPDSVVFATIARTAPGKADDETEMDVIDVWASPGAGFIDLRLTGLTGSIARGFTIDYVVTEG